jgi:MFS family permease
MVSAQRVTSAIVALCLLQFVDVLGVTVVVTALPDMLTSVGASASSSGYVATGYAMFFGGLLMFGARLGDRIGHRRTILLSLAVFATGAVLAAVATSIITLTAARCVQGAAAACAVPSALRLLTSVASEGQTRSRALAAWSAAGAAAGASGFVVGGLVTDLASWRYIFWGYLPVAVLLGLAIVRAVPPDEPDQVRTPLNLATAGLLTITVMAVVAGATEVAEPKLRWLGAALLAAAIVLTPALRWLDRRSPAPLLPGPLFRQPPLRRGAIGSFLNTATTSSVATAVTLYVQDKLGHSPISAAATLLPFSFAVIAGSALSAPALRRLRPEQVSATGLAAIALTDAMLPLVSTKVAAVAAVMVIAGVGLGLSSVASNSLGTDVVEADRATASGVINTAAQVGTAVGIATILLVADVTTGSPTTATPTLAWAVAAAVAAVGAVRFALAR